MIVFSEELTFSTVGYCDIVDITPQLSEVVKKSKIIEGLINISIAGSTAAVTTLEYEPGLINDLKETMEKLVPSNRSYAHDKTWGDGNGFSHIRSALLGTTKSFPIKAKAMVLGTWQQIVLIDFDNKKRSRKVIVQVLGK